MTTAARPTFDPAKGGSGIKESGKISHLVSARDLPGHLKLKERLPGQNTADELKEKDFKSELEERERIAQIEKSGESSHRYVPSLEQATQVRLALKAERDREREAHKEALLNSETINESASSQVTAPTLIDARKMAQLDKDEDFGSDYNDADFEADEDDNLDGTVSDEENSDSDEADDDDDDDDEDEDDEDDTEALMAELQKIRQERMAEQERQGREKEERLRPGASAGSTIDDDASSVFSVKRRWDDDVPFKNCARDGPNPKRKLYVNDTLRQEFHKKFMDKYIR